MAKDSASMTSPMYVDGKYVGTVGGPKGGKDAPDPQGGLKKGGNGK